MWRVVQVGWLVVASACGRGGFEDVCVRCADHPEDVYTGPTLIYRSVGPGSMAPLATGAANPLSLADSRATFTNALPARVGIGDVIELDTSGDGSIDSVAFIHARLSDREFEVRDALGGELPWQLRAVQSWSLLRAYLSLAGAVAGSGYENVGLDPGVRAFETFTLGRDLAANDEIWNIACYGDAVDGTPVTAEGAPAGGWRTDDGHYLRIYTPTSPSEVGARQRHAGRWTAAAYSLETDASDSLLSGVDFLRIEGLQIHNISTTSGTMRSGIDLRPVGDASDVWVSHNVIRATRAAPSVGNSGIAILPGGAAAFTRVWNNVIYDFNIADGTGIYVSDGALLAYNNTIYNCVGGIATGSGAGAQVIRNNLVQSYVVDNSFTDYQLGTGVHSGNLSSDATSPDAALRNLTVQFTDAAGRDLHLAASDTAARGRGDDLSSDQQLTITDDIDGQGRSPPWDIGADEAN